MNVTINETKNKSGRFQKQEKQKKIMTKINRMKIKKKKMRMIQENILKQMIQRKRRQKGSGIVR